MKKHAVCALTLMTMLLLFGATTANAADYPAKPIQLVVGFPPGGGNDLAARVFAEFANRFLPHPMVVTNITGGTGSVAAQHVLRAKPDGYTLFWEQPTMSCQTSAGIVDYSFRDFDIVNSVMTSTGVIAASKKLPVKTAQELVQYMKEHPGEVRWPMSYGALSHFYYLYFDNGAGGEPMKPKRVANAGDADRLVALIGGHADATGVTVASIKPYLNDVTLIGVATEKRLDVLPGVPTLKEQGINATYSYLLTLFAPKGTPDEVKKVLSEVTKKVLALPECQKTLAELSITPNFLPAEEAAALWQKQEDLNNAIVTKYKLKEETKK